MEGKTPELAQLTELSGPPPNVPLRGYLVREDNDQYWIQDRQGTWCVKKADVVASQDWQGADPRFDGKPICVFIRGGAEIFELRRYKVLEMGNPITVVSAQTSASPKVAGEEELQTTVVQMVRHLGVKPGESAVPMLYRGTTTSCWADPSGWGIVCQDDDCGYDGY